MIEICSKDICTGCGMCASACAFGAIQMQEDAFLGHLRPTIDPQKCRECGRCQRLCPSNHCPEQIEPFMTYAAWSENEQERESSSSGGIVASLYRQFIHAGGYIVGTLMDDQMTVKMQVANDEEAITRFKGSKYVQAQSGNVYAECVKLLKQGNRVLFAGTPCQCAAMKNLANGNMDNLYLVELICHGVPSPKAWKTHYSKLRDTYGDRIKITKFRSKNFSICLTLEDDCGHVLYQKNKMEDPYLMAFLSGELFGAGCFSCQYAQRKRVADLVVGDFWGLGEKKAFPYPTKKVSVIGVVTEKGKQLLDMVDTLKLVERDFDEAVEGNPQLRTPYKKPEGYDAYIDLPADDRINRIMYNSNKIACAEKQYRRRKRKEQIMYPFNQTKKMLKALLHK